MWKYSILLISACLLLSSCASSSEHYKEKRMIKGKEVEVDVIKQTGMIKAKHPTGAEAESKPWIEIPSFPIKYEP